MKIELEATFPHSSELVWEALNNSAALDQWLMRNDFKPEVGHKFEFLAKPTRGWNGICEAEVKALEKHRKAVWVWDRNGKHPWTVTWTLEPTLNGGTRLILQHDGFRGLGGFLLSRLIMRKGWRCMVKQQLPQVLNFMEKNGTKFPKGYIVPSRAKNS